MSFRQKPESSFFKQLQSIWTSPGLDPGSTGVTAFYELVNFDGLVKSLEIVMPDLIRHPERIEFTGFRLSPE
ncbi:MAG: hypothetical protein QME06_03310 [Desulfobacterales bacterium]|nr:hypothetical protein [Desulfobacterales bacterium]